MGFLSALFCLVNTLVSLSLFPSQVNFFTQSLICKVVSSLIPFKIFISENLSFAQMYFVSLFKI